MKKLMLVLCCHIGWQLSSYACGPDFPAVYLNYKESPNSICFDFKSELIILVREFRKELKVPAKISVFSSLSLREAVEKDFKECLSKHLSGMTKKEKRQLLREYLAARTSVSRGGNMIELIVDRRYWCDNPYLQEFKLYLIGVGEMRKNKKAVLPKAWQALLKLPPDKRKYRTAWVLYMAGNLAAQAGDLTKSYDCYRKVRNAAKSGYADSLGLSHATRLREFKMETDPVEKIYAGLRALGCCSEDSGEFKWITEHLKVLANMTKYPEFVQENLLDDPVCREFLCTYAGCRNFFDDYCSYGYNDFLKKLNGRKVRQAYRIAHLAYNKGKIKLCEKWIAACPDDSLVKIWLQAKIYRKRGEYKQAAKKLRTWLKLYDERKKFYPKYPNELEIKCFDYQSRRMEFTRDVRAELGCVMVSAYDFFEAMECFKRAKSWYDMAYVAERLLSSKQLRQYVDVHCQDYNSDYDSNLNMNKYDFYFYEKTGSSGAFNNCLKYLLARRLMREEKYDLALKYFPYQLAVVAGQYLEFKRKSEDKKYSLDQRALASYNAAKLMRHYGMSLVGTELYPDCHYCLGGFSDDDSRKPFWWDGAVAGKIKALAEKHLLNINLRFHYRFKAAEMMRQAANQARLRDLKALCYFAGGCYIKGRDPKRADLQYKPLARLRPHPLAVAADNRRWFPMEYSEKLNEEIYSPKPLRTLAQVSRIVTKPGNQSRKP